MSINPAVTFSDPLEEALERIASQASGSFGRLPLDLHIASEAKLLARSYGLSVHDLEDLEQEARLALHRAREEGRLPDGEAGVAFARQIVRRIQNRQFNAAKARRRRVLVGDIEQQPPKPTIPPEAIEYALAVLPGRNALVFQLVFVFGLKHEEAAEALGITRKAVSSLWGRTLCLLATIWAELEPE